MNKIIKILIMKRVWEILYSGEDDESSDDEDNDDDD